MKDAKGHGSDPRSKIAHMAGVLAATGKQFLKSESGEGNALNHEGAAHYFRELMGKQHDPEALSRLSPEVHEQLVEGGVPHLGTLVHLAHFLGCLGGIALVTEFAHIVGWWS